VEIDNYLARDFELFDEEEVATQYKPRCPICKRELVEGEVEGCHCDWVCTHCDKEFDNTEVEAV